MTREHIPEEKVVRRKPEDKTTVQKKRADNSGVDKTDLVGYLQREVGNQAVQRMLNTPSGEAALEEEVARKHQEPSKAEKTTAGSAGLSALVQRLVEEEGGTAQAGESEEEKAGAQPKQIEIGEVKIPRPKQVNYEVSGQSASEAMQEVLKMVRSGQWLEYKFKYTYKLDEKGVVTEVKVEVEEIEIKVPQWGGLATASSADKRQWERMLASLQIYDDDLEMDTLLAPAFAEADMKTAPDATKSAWKELMKTTQEHEEKLPDRIRRQAMLLQQRLVAQPENLVKATYDQFLKDIEEEADVYNSRIKLDGPTQISLGSKLAL